MTITGRVHAGFRGVSSSIPLQRIDGYWQSEGFAPGEYIGYGGQRVSRGGEYEANVQWDNADHERCTLRVYELVLFEVGADVRDRLTSVLHHDGFSVTDGHRIVAATPELPPLVGLAALRGAGGIEEAFTRISLLVERDPAGVVAALKELLEASAKSVLESRAVAYTDRQDFSSLAPRAQEALGLGARGVSESVDGANSVGRILGGLASVAQGVDGLRNAKGGGHGRARGSRLAPRHARLAFKAARAWCEIVLETLAVEDAPWRRPQ